MRVLPWDRPCTRWKALQYQACASSRALDAMLGFRTVSGLLIQMLWCSGSLHASVYGGLQIEAAACSPSMCPSSRCARWLTCA